MKGGRCFGGHGYKEVTKGLLEALVLKGGDGGACKLLGRLLGDVIEVLEGFKMWIRVRIKGRLRFRISVRIEIRA
ncbi:hypothetical protein Tco_0236629 [Tanacetum coccineum]